MRKRGGYVRITKEILNNAVRHHAKKELERLSFIHRRNNELFDLVAKGVATDSDKREYAELREEKKEIELKIAKIKQGVFYER